MPASALDASDTAEPLLDASLEAAPPPPQDMDRGEESGGDQHEAAAGATTECGLVDRMRQMWDGQIACLSTSSDEEDCLLLGALSASAEPHDTSAPALAVLTHSDIGPGLLVRRIDDAASHGTVLGRQARRVRVDFSASGGRPSTWVENWNELTATVENLAVYRARWVELRSQLRSQFSQGAHAKTAEGVVSLVMMDASAEGMHANEVKLQLADGSQTDWVKVETLSKATQAEVAEYNAAPWVVMLALRTQFRRGTHAKTADGDIGMVVQSPQAYTHERGRRFANTVHLRLVNGSQTDRLQVDTLTVVSEAEYEAEKAVWAALCAKFELGAHVKTVGGTVGVVVGDATAWRKDRTGYHGTSAARAASIIESGFRPSAGGMLGAGVYWTDDLRKVGHYSDGTVLKVSVKCGRTAKITGQGHALQRSWNDQGYDTAWVPAGCGMVQSELSENCTYDPSRVQVVAISDNHGAAGSWRSVGSGEPAQFLSCKCNEVILRLNNGSETGWLEQDQLTVATEAEITEYDAERSRWAELRRQFSQGTHAKTAESVVGLVIMDASEEGSWIGEMDANEVKLQLADGSQTDWVQVDLLAEATQAEVADYRVRAQFRHGTHAKTAEGAVGVVMDDAPADGPDANTVHLQLAADGSQTGRLSLDTLTVATEAEYEAEVARCGTEHEAEVARAKLAVDDHNLRHWGRTIG